MIRSVVKLRKRSIFGIFRFQSHGKVFDLCRFQRNSDPGGPMWQPTWAEVFQDCAIKQNRIYRQQQHQQQSNL